MAKNIIKHLPIFLQDVYEFKRITDSENIELNNLQAQVDSMLNETIIENASDYRNK